MFATACASGEVDRFWGAVNSLYGAGPDGWRLAMMRVSRLPAVSAEIHAAFLEVWIESKQLALRVGDRPTFARALRILMPGDYHGAALRVYRGTSGLERRRRLYGFSWTRHQDVARRFAAHWAKPIPGLETGGVVLETLCAAEAVLLIRKDENYYDEGEVVVDPYKLGAVTVAERLLSPGAASQAIDPLGLGVGTQIGTQRHRTGRHATG